MRPNHRQSFDLIVLLALAGFALVLTSGYWHLIALAIVAAFLFGCWRLTRR